MFKPTEMYIFHIISIPNDKLLMKSCLEFGCGNAGCQQICFMLGSSLSIPLIVLKNLSCLFKKNFVYMVLCK